MKSGYTSVLTAFCLLIFLMYHDAVAQDIFPEQIRGYWVADGSIFSNRIREVRDIEFGFTYLGYRFEKNKLCISYNPFETNRCISDAKFKGDTLWVLETPLYILRFLDQQTIDLTKINGGITQRLRKISSSDFKYKADSVYQATPEVHPIHESLFSILFFFNSLIIYPAPRADQVISIELTVTSKGNVEDVKVLSDHSRIRKRWFRRSLIDSSGEWLPAMVENMPVNCRLKLDLVRVGYKTLEAEEKAWKYYNNALRYITKSNYTGALINLNDALVYAPGNPRLLFTRAVCHFYLKDEKKQCEDVLKAKEGCPFIPTAMADEQLGILVECFKGQ